MITSVLYNVRISALSTLASALGCFVPQHLATVLIIRQIFLFCETVSVQCFSLFYSCAILMNLFFSLFHVTACKPHSSHHTIVCSLPGKSLETEYL